LWDTAVSVTVSDSSCEISIDGVFSHNIIRNVGADAAFNVPVGAIRMPRKVQGFQFPDFAFPKYSSASRDGLPSLANQ
jgi:hypothetical protein